MAGWALVDLTWPEALLVGAALAPTDPVFAAAIVGREEAPSRLRHLLNVESGLNDGLALAFVVAFTAWAGHRDVAALSIVTELMLGVALGIAVPWAAVRLERSRAFGASEQYRPIGVFAVGLLVFALAANTHTNEFLPAFSAGATLATIAPRAPAAFARLGDTGSELLKLAALLVFGSMLSPRFLGELGLGGWVFGLMALFGVRPLAIAVALAGSPLGARERAVAAWFGPNRPPTSRRALARAESACLVQRIGRGNGAHASARERSATATSGFLRHIRCRRRRPITRRFALTFNASVHVVERPLVGRPTV
jgi:NhaP-type Na+/H+ or K+/H+ antiporter